MKFVSENIEGFCENPEVKKYLWKYCSEEQRRCVRGHSLIYRKDSHLSIEVENVGKVILCYYAKEEGVVCMYEDYSDDYIESDVVVNIIDSTLCKEEWVRVNNTIGKFPIVKISKYTTKHAIVNGFLKKSTSISMEGVIELSNGQFLINSYGKYEPNISFLNKKPDVEYEWVKTSPTQFNLPQGDLYVIRGSFFTSKKGTRCFRINPKGEHILLRDSWGGAFERYRGRTMPEEGSLYYRRASSNGGGAGYDYAVYPVDWKYTLDEEDI